MTLIDADDYPAVRAALDVSLTADVLTNEVIGLNIYQGAAEARVLEIDSAAEGYTGSELLRVQRAVVYLTAALLAPAVPQIVQAAGQHLSYSRREIDWEARADELEALALAELGAEPAYTTGSVTTVRVDAYSNDLNNIESDL